ncbi:DUF2264 domain-containing protein [uncultured Pseudokineococcus sp.]|uniref:DUF2264 domain-containing protein n=1 Tax=uncultured Pseudokineococcus sp. TaxID=1642928 RepID=UPI0026248139|nr:DUF2264 domain-containing protein [uncultured Pseudokineococcus sp.]
MDRGHERGAASREAAARARAGTDLPAPDWARSPRTGWGREHWAAVADRVLLALRPFATADRAGFALPGPPSGAGPASDALEAFARSLVLAALRVRGEGGEDPHGLMDWYREGLVAGTDPRSPTRWPRPDEVPQARVEAASLAVALDLSRPWLLDRLAPREHEQVLDWFQTCVGAWYPDSNWVWFRTVVETLLVAEGRDVPPEGLAGTLALHEQLARADGWTSDGGERAFDHYGDWVLHHHPHLWVDQARRTAPHLLEAARLPDGTAAEEVWRRRLGRYLADVLALQGADGSPLVQGRSLVYRMTAASLWTGAATGAGDLPPGLLRRAATGQLQHFLGSGCLDERGLLSLGWHGAFPVMKQSYTGPGSTYWASTGFSGLALPADHPAWTDVEEPLPVEEGDVRRLVRAPGWLVSGTRADGVVRVLNHGTDHALPGDERTEAPLYARLGYSTATAPPLTGPTTTAPVDSTAALLDAAGAPSHRSGMVTGDLLDDGVALRGSSSVRAHWVDGVDPAAPDHASGLPGRVRWGPRVTTTSLVRGAWEVRVVAVAPRGADDEPAPALRVGGWPVAGPEVPGAEDRTPPGGAQGRAASASAGGLSSSVHLALPAAEGSPTGARCGVHRESGTSPLGEHVAVPWVQVPLDGTAALVVAVVGLAGAGTSEAPPEIRSDGRHLGVLWDGGARSSLEVP